MLVTRHAYPERTVELHFYEARLTNEPSPQIGQQMRWAGREELEALEFPEADAELIRMLVAKQRAHDGATARRHEDTL
jgi:hypothetical protein